MEALDKEKLKRIQIEQLETERKELESRMKTLAKRLDHLERAYRKEEAPVLEIAFRDKKAQDEAHHHSAYKMLLDATKRQYLTNLEGKKRMCRMMEHMQTYKASIQQTKAEAFEKLKEEMEAKKNKEKQARFVKVKTEKERELLEKERMEQERLEAERERQSKNSCVFIQCIHVYNSSRTKGSGNEGSGRGRA